jgi:hypothetical protein
MNITVDNKRIEKMLNDYNHDCELMENNQEQYLRNLKYKDNNEVANGILFGYLDFIIELSESSKIKLDLTYDSVKNLMVGLGLSFNNYYSNRGKEKAIENMIKVFASYLTLLCINMNNARLKVNRVNRATSSTKHLWAEALSIKVDGVDFLPVCWQSVEDNALEVEDSIVLDVTQPIIMYKEITGIDLSEYGLSNLVWPIIGKNKE